LPVNEIISFITAQVHHCSHALYASAPGSSDLSTNLSYAILKPPWLKFKTVPA